VTYYEHRSGLSFKSRRRSGSAALSPACARFSSSLHLRRVCGGRLHDLRRGGADACDRPPHRHARRVPSLPHPGLPQQPNREPRDADFEIDGKGMNSVGFRFRALISEGTVPSHTVEVWNRVEYWVSGCPLRDRRKRQAIHLNWNTWHGVLLVQVSAALPKIVTVAAVSRTFSTSTDATAAATAANASAARAYQFAARCEDSTPVVDAAAIAPNPLWANDTG
jgi:hypothetical protein